jgi:DnaJ-class molecular chaperone
MGSKDYYAILGVHRLASDDEIKRAYKQKALKHHPDKNRGDVDAEKKFMDISEAYEMLSDPYKRSLYDRFGSEELRNYLGTDPRTNFRPTGTQYSDFGPDSNHEYTYDPYNNYFVRYKDPSTFYDLYVTLEEVNKGATRKMKITRKRFNTELNTTVRDEKLLEIQVKPGWKEGTKITFEGEGDEGDQNTIAGDIVFIIRDKPHPIFERSNSDLIYRVKLSIKQALLGMIINIPFLDSTKPPYQLRAHQEIITPQTEKRFPNEGLPYPKDPTRRGDLIVKFDILFPKLLNNEQRTLIDCCFSNSIDFYQPCNSVLHTTIIEQIQQPPPPPPPPPPQSTPISIPKSQSAPMNNAQKVFNVHVNGHQKSASSPTKSSNKIKISPVRTGPSVPPPPPAPPSSPAAASTIKETVF